MKINWKVRVKNPVFWMEIAAAILLPILTHLGFNWNDMTTWGALGTVLLEAIGNPVIVVSVLVSVWNAITDPTTSGINDSSQAMSYDKPKSE